MSGSFERFLAAVLLIVVAPRCSLGEEGSLGIDPSLVIEQFDVYNDGDLLLVPVTAFGKERMFAVDTGCSHMHYDDSLRPFLGKSLRNVALRSLNGKVDVEVFKSPSARLGSLSLYASQEVGCRDFARLNRLDGHDTQGIIGISVLRERILHIDFDAGKLSFLKQVPQDAGERFQVLYWRGVPAIEVQIHGVGGVPFLIDTGLVSDDAGNLNGEAANSLTRWRLAEFEDSATMTADISGEAEELQSVRIKRMKLGSHAMINVPMSIGTGDSPSSLSLAFLSRFNITFDFPDRAIYLKKNKNFDRPYRPTTGGIAFVRDDAGVVVDDVQKGSPGAAAGIQAKDVVLKIGDQEASRARLFKLYEEFTVPGRTVHVRLLRDGEIFETDVKLPLDEEKDSVARSQQQ